MTVIRPNSISGVSSITGQGGDISIFRADGTAGDLTINNIVGGAATFTGVLSYEDVTNVDSVGVITARSGIRIGATGANTLITGNATGIGINTNTSGASTNAPLTIKNSTNSSATRFNLVNSGSSQTESTQIYSQNNDLAFVAGANERLRIGSSGQLGIAGANYGTSGQVLTSQGASSAVQWATPAAGGKILQVVQSVKTNTQSFSTGSSTLSDSYFDITGLSVSITPASGTKCFVSYTVNVGGQSGYGQGLALFRDSTQIYLGNADGSTIRLSNFDYTVDNKKIDTMAGQFLDTHGANGSTAVTYKLQMYVASPGWTTRVNRSQSTSSDRYYGRCASSITVMEVGS